MISRLMTFTQWRQFSPQAAAREVRSRAKTRLSSAQQRAAIAILADEDALTARFTAASPSQPLGRIPYFAKDLFDVTGWPTLAGSTFLPEVRATPTEDAALIRALASHGAVLAGKTHLHEFAYGVTGENPNYGDVEHPRFPGRTTGGSSSGSAAVVAAGVVPFALGTDTGGSVRVPAAFCGLFGFRLPPGDAFIQDVFPLAPSFDTAGWFTAHADDLRVATAALVGGFRSGSNNPQGIYLELPGLDPDVAAACCRAANLYAPPAPDATARELLHGFSGAAEAYHTVVAQESWEVHRGWAERFRHRYSPTVWQRLNRAHSVTDAQREAAKASLAAIRTLWRNYFQSYDFLILPASPSAALTKVECTLENRSRILALTAPASIGGLPVLTIPVPLPSGLTTGLQIVVNDPRSPVIDWVLRTP